MKHATPNELAYRVRQYAWRFRIARRARNKRDVAGEIPALSSRDLAALELPVFSGEIDHAVLRDIADGKVFCHNADWERIQAYERKMRSIYSGSIPVSSCPLDIRTVWEPARLQHLTYLFAALQKNDGNLDCSWCREFARNDLVSWVRCNPFPYGPHFLSAMECALRIPVFMAALKLLHNLSERERGDIGAAVYRHAWWIEHNLSLYSSRGNHTVSEAVGLVFAGALFRKDSRGALWLQRGTDLLLQELNHQILADGGPAEQSFSYHRFVLDLYWLAIDFMERNRLRSCEDFRRVTLAGEGFLAAMEHAPGAVPPVGDGDDGHVVAPGLAPQRERCPAPRLPVSTFKESGYTVIRGTQGAVLTFDHGPLGMAPLHGHGHADALSVTLSLDGEALLVDPDTCAYNGAAEVRAYFRSTRAHNTVTIDGLDQAHQETGFVWGQPYRTGVVRSMNHQGLPLIEALHDGYARLNDQVRHKRLIALVDGCHFLIRDSFWGEGCHQFELNYHLHPDASLKRDGDWWHIQKNGKNLFLKMPDDRVRVAYGQERPLLGWFSDRYGSRRECMVVQSTKSGHPDEVNFVSLLCVASTLSHGMEERLVCEVERLA